VGSLVLQAEMDRWVGELWELLHDSGKLPTPTPTAPKAKKTKQRHEATAVPQQQQVEHLLHAAEAAVAAAAGCGDVEGGCSLNERGGDVAEAAAALTAAVEAMHQGRNSHTAAHSERAAAAAHKLTAVAAVARRMGLPGGDAAAAAASLLHSLRLDHQNAARYVFAVFLPLLPRTRAVTTKRGSEHYVGVNSAHTTCARRTY
jgi:hypothetical protein